MRQLWCQIFRYAALVAMPARFTFKEFTSINNVCQIEATGVMNAQKDLNMIRECMQRFEDLLWQRGYTKNNQTCWQLGFINSTALTCRQKLSVHI